MYFHLIFPLFEAAHYSTNHWCDNELVEKVEILMIWGSETSSFGGQPVWQIEFRAINMVQNDRDSMILGLDPGGLPELNSILADRFETGRPHPRRSPALAGSGDTDCSSNPPNRAHTFRMTLVASKLPQNR